MQVNLKYCPGCKEDKPVGKFARNRARPDGHQSWCRACCQRKYYERHPERAPEAPRANRHGSACPDWCQTDHERMNMHIGRVIDTHMSAPMASGDVYPRVLLSQSGPEYGNPAPEVQVSGVSMPGCVFVSPWMAGDLADLVESLAGCPPERLRDLADEIRVAASVLAGGAK